MNKWAKGTYQRQPTTAVTQTLFYCLVGLKDEQDVFNVLKEFHNGSLKSKKEFDQKVNGIKLSEQGGDACQLLRAEKQRLCETVRNLTEEKTAAEAENQRLSGEIDNLKKELDKSKKDKAVTKKNGETKKKAVTKKNGETKKKGPTATDKTMDNHRQAVMDESANELLQLMNGEHQEREEQPEQDVYLPEEIQLEDMPENDVTEEDVLPQGPELANHHTHNHPNHTITNQSNTSFLPPHVPPRPSHLQNTHMSTQTHTAQHMTNQGRVPLSPLQSNMPQYFMPSVTSTPTGRSNNTNRFIPQMPSVSPISSPAGEGPGVQYKYPLQTPLVFILFLVCLSVAI
ncbi:uncharacterized protein LOC144915105 [Branchiostoma floridae x Branchiostoma belcheri]